MSTAVFAEIQAGRAIQITISGVPPEEKGRSIRCIRFPNPGPSTCRSSARFARPDSRPSNWPTFSSQRYKAAKIYTHPTFQVFDSDQKTIEQQTVVVGGFVRRPGPVPYNRNLTLWQAIQSAGGATEFGSMERVKLTRAGKVKQYDANKPQFQQIPLEPDDAIEVPQKNWLGH